MSEISDEEFQEHLNYFLEQLQIRGHSEEEAQLGAEAFVQKFGKENLVAVATGQKAGYRVASALIRQMTGED